MYLAISIFDAADMPLLSSALRSVTLDHGFEIFSSRETYGRQVNVAKVMINDLGTLNEAKRLNTFELHVLHE